VSFTAINRCLASQRSMPKVSIYFFIDPVLKLLDTPSYYSPHIIRVLKSMTMRWTVGVVTMRTVRNTVQLLVGEPVGKRPLGKRSRRWEDNMKTNLGETGWDSLDWIHLAQNRDQ
jgi:hypothetical protein